MYDDTLEAYLRLITLEFLADYCDYVEDLEFFVSHLSHGISTRQFGRDAQFERSYNEKDEKGGSLIIEFRLSTFALTRAKVQGKNLKNLKWSLSIPHPPKIEDLNGLTSSEWLSQAECLLLESDDEESELRALKEIEKMTDY